MKNLKFSSQNYLNQTANLTGLLRKLAIKGLTS